MPDTPTRPVPNAYAYASALHGPSRVPLEAARARDCELPAHAANIDDMASGKEPKTSSGVPLRVIARDLGSPAIAGAHMTAFAGLTPESVAATIRDANVNADRDRDRLAAVREASAVVDQTCLEVRRQMARTPLSASDREKLETSMIALQRVFGTGAIGEVPAAAAELRAVAENIFGGPEDD